MVPLAPICLQTQAHLIYFLPNQGRCVLCEAFLLRLCGPVGLGPLKRGYTLARRRNQEAAVAASFSSLSDRICPSAKKAMESEIEMDGKGGSGAELALDKRSHPL